MRLIANAVIGAFIALAAPSFAAPVAYTVPLHGQQSSVAVRPQISVDAQSLNVVIDREGLAQLKAGQLVSINIAGEGRFSYLVERLINDPDVIEITGHLRDNPEKTITLGLRPEGLSGLIKTNNRIYALGYANKVQYFGDASSRWMAKELANEAPVLESKTTALGGKPPVKGAEAIDLNLALLSSMKVGDGTVMQLPGMGYARVALDQIRAGDGSTTWVGHLSDFGDGYKAILTYSPGGTVGTILTPAGEVNVTIGADGQQYAYNPTELGLTNVMQSGESCAVLHEATSGLQSLGSSAAAVAATSAATPVVAQATTPGNIVDVLVYYTPGMLTAYSNLAGVTARIDALIALANQAYATGKLSYQVRRVGLELLNVADSSSNSTLLGQMQTRSASFVGMNAKRDAVGADLVTVVRPLYASAQGSCGVGYVSGANGTNVTLYGEYGLSVVSDGADRSGAPYSCTNSTFAHELGHNMGLMHDRATTAQQGGGTGAKPYAFGYVPPSGKWGTIMSYTTPYVVSFSNPLDTTCNTNEVCGTPQTSSASADNVAALAFTMPMIAGFRPSVQSTDKFSVSGVVSVNGTAVAGAILAVANVTGGAATNVTCTASGTNGAYSCTAPRGYAFQLTPSYKLASGATIAWTPASVSVPAIVANQTANFSGVSSDAKFTLSGVVTVNGAATAGVAIKVSGTDAAKVSCLATSSSGAYSCAAPAGASFTVTPSMTVAAGSTLTWSPANASVAKMAANSTASFAGNLAIPKFNLSGIVKVNGAAAVGVAMKVSGTDAAKVSCQATTSAGVYTCSAPVGSSFIVTPSMTLAAGSTLTWSPANAAVTKMAANSTASFAGSLTVPKYTLSGIVKVNGAAMLGVAMSVSGTDAAKVSCLTTTSAGAYSCSAPAGSSFAITPTLTVASGSTLTWSPASVVVNRISGNVTVPFAGTLTGPLRTLTVAMTVNGTKTLSVGLRIGVNGDVSKVSCSVAADTTIKCKMPSNYGVTVTPVPTSSRMSFSPSTLTLPSLQNDSTMTFVGKII